MTSAMPNYRPSRTGGSCDRGTARSPKARMAVGGRKPCVAPQSRSMYETSIADWFARVFTIRALATAWCTARTEPALRTLVPARTSKQAPAETANSGGIFRLRSRADRTHDAGAG